MVVRAPVFAYILWLAIVLSPQLITLLVYMLGLHPLVIGLAFFVATFGSNFIYLSLIRHTRRRVLQSMYRQAARRQSKPFVLISRSYDQSKAFRTATAAPHPSLPAVDLTLLETLIYDLSHQHPIVVLGDKDIEQSDPGGRALYMCSWPTESSRPPRIVFDAASGESVVSSTVCWEQVFVNLAEVAQHVVLIPASTEGLLREVALLRQHRLGSKTVVFMWPHRGAHPNHAICESATTWAALQKQLQAAGLSLPTHRRGGAMISLDDDLEVRNIHEPLPKRDFLDAVGPQKAVGKPLCDVAAMIERYELASNAERYAPMWGYSISE
ncbi:MAG: hypothetical protein K0V04_19540 [Deltaproteobacteria bacterium]|nr:hypothetical protein [Deltaproteobacteria bacterium]